MRLTKFKYSWENQKWFDDWFVEGIDLGDLNLIVGKNATGKSRIIQTIYSFKKMIDLSEPTLFSGNWEMHFNTESGDHLVYYLNTSRQKVISERLLINGKARLVRDTKSAFLYSHLHQNRSQFWPPEDRLIIHVRRDIREFPFLEFLADWASTTFGFKFGQIHPGTLAIDKTHDRLTSIEEIPSLIAKMSKDSLNKVMTEFNSLGYELTEISATERRGETQIIISEKHLKEQVPQYLLSQGMFRSLCLLIFIQNLIDNGKVATLLVDDLGEGLDYDRTVKLGKLVYEKLKNRNIQFIASSNDNFLMDVVDIKYWNILVREKNRVKSFNYQTHKEQFDKFRFSGLSNFDLFSSDYLAVTQ